MKQPKRPTIGSLVQEIRKHDFTETESLLPQEFMDQYIKDLNECAEVNLQKFDKDFYIEEISYNERLMPEVMRVRFIAKQACPLPTLNQTIYKVDRKKGQVSLLWVIPDEVSVNTYSKFRNEVVKEEQQILNYILRFLNGDLELMAKELNGEREANSLIL